MSLLPLVLVLAASPAKLVVPTLNAAGIDGAKIRFFTTHLATQLRSRGLEVVTSDEISTMLGIERQHELLGCADSSACLAELSNALGTSATVRGTVALVDGEYAINVSVLGNTANVVAEYSARVSTEGAVLDALSTAAERLADSLQERASPPGRFRAHAVVPFIAGVLVAGAGGLLLGLASSDYDSLGRDRFMAGQPEALVARGTAFNASGWVGLGVGVAALVLGVVLFVLDGRGL